MMQRRWAISFLVGAAILALAACDDRPRSWKAYVYPDIEDMEKVTVKDGFRTFEECQDVATSVLASLTEMNRTGASGGDYVCGYRCGFKAEYGMEICKDKRK